MVKSTRITLAEDFQGGLNSDVRVPRQFLKESLWLKHDIVRGRATGKLLKIQETTSHPATCKQSQFKCYELLKKKKTDVEVAGSCVGKKRVSGGSGRKSEREIMVDPHQNTLYIHVKLSNGKSKII